MINPLKVVHEFLPCVAYGIANTICLIRFRNCYYFCEYIFYFNQTFQQCASNPMNMNATRTMYSHKTLQRPNHKLPAHIVGCLLELLFFFALLLFRFGLFPLSIGYMNYLVCLPMQNDLIFDYLFLFFSAG